MFRETGCDAVMIGRAAASNPWIFRQMAQYFSTGRYDEPTAADRFRLLREFFRRLLDPATAPLLVDHPLAKMKQFASRFTHTVAGGAALRKAIYDCRRPEEVLARVDAFFSNTTATGPNLDLKLTEAAAD